MGNGRRLAVSAGTAIAGAPISYVVQRMLGAWGVLDGLADAFGRYLKLHMSASQAGWTIALIFTLALYAGALWVIWHKRQAGAVAPVTSPVFGEAEVATVSPPAAREYRTWDDPAPITPKRDVGLVEALAYAMTGQWGSTYREAALSASSGEAIVELLDEFRQKAHDGELTIWGKSNPSSVWDKVPRHHWKENDVDPFDLAKGNARTFCKTRKYLPHNFYALMACRAEFEREWPHV